MRTSPSLDVSVVVPCGRTLPSSIIDLSEPKGDRAELAYVKLSRLRRGNPGHPRFLSQGTRSKHDVNLLTTGVDSKATLFYITDYVTKSELSHIQSVTLLKICNNHNETRGSDYGAGLLPLVLGMPVMLKNNVGTELCLANGMNGVVEACRNELFAVVTFMSSPNIFLTLNPADHGNPFVCLWDGLMISYVGGEGGTGKTGQSKVLLA